MKERGEKREGDKEGERGRRIKGDGERMRDEKSEQERKTERWDRGTGG